MTRRSQKGVPPPCPHSFSANLELALREAGSDPKLRSDVVERMGVSREPHLEGGGGPGVRKGRVSWPDTWVAV